MTTAMASAKQVHFIARYAHKTNKKLNGFVTYAVRSSNGNDIYCTTLINGKASGCSCPARKPCYHMTQLEAREAARKPLKAPITESVDNRTSQAVTSEEPKPTYRLLRAPGLKRKRFDLVEYLEEKREHHFQLLGEIREIQERASEERMMKATLTSNQGFQLMR